MRVAVCRSMFMGPGAPPASQHIPCEIGVAALPCRVPRRRTPRSQEAARRHHSGREKRTPRERAMGTVTRATHSYWKGDRPVKPALSEGSPIDRWRFGSDPMRGNLSSRRGSEGHGGVPGLIPNF